MQTRDNLEAVTGEKYTVWGSALYRANSDGADVIQFSIEEVTEIGPVGARDIKRKSVGTRQLFITDFDASFDLIHPVTGAKIGHASFNDLFVMLNSVLKRP